LEPGDRRDRAGPGTRSGVLVAVGISSVVGRPRLSSSETFGQLAQGLRAALTIENFERSRSTKIGNLDVASGSGIFICPDQHFLCGAAGNRTRFGLLVSEPSRH
jgi:hypothetical protein